VKGEGLKVKKWDDEGRRKEADRGGGDGEKRIIVGMGAGLSTAGLRVRRKEKAEVRSQEKDQEGQRVGGGNDLRTP